MPSRTLGVKILREVNKASKWGLGLFSSWDVRCACSVCERFWMLSWLHRAWPGASLRSAWTVLG
jgi:hypothetical protein